MDLRRNSDKTYLLIPDPGTEFVLFAMAMYDKERKVIKFDSADRIEGADKRRVYTRMANYLLGCIDQMDAENETGS